MKWIFLLSLLSSFAFADINVAGDKARYIWDSAETIAEIDDIPFFNYTDTISSFHMEDITCVFDEYYACSFYVTIDSERKLFASYFIVENLIRALARAGVFIDEEFAKIDVEDLFCTRNDKEYECQIVEYPYNWE